jgi:glycosyltransferase involved in cell wall biosynthesis
MKVLIVGDYPPPYGGSSVQVSVLHHRLSALRGFTCRVLDVGTARRRKRPECLPARNAAEFAVRLLSYAARQYLVHLHTNGHNFKSWLMTLACAVAGLANGRRTLVSIGSGSAPDFIETARPASRLIITVALRLIGGVICRNERGRATILGLGIPGDKVAIVSGFYGIGMHRPSAFPPPIDEFLRAHSPVVAAIASSGPEYGIPLLLEATRRLATSYPRLGVLLVGPERYADPGLDGNLLATGELRHELVLAIMRRLDLFVRPTYFDGDASSVREALMLGVRVVASDTDFRPDGVVRFRKGDARDLTEKIADVLGDGSAVGTRLRSSDPDSLERLLAIYSCLGRASLCRRGPR